MAMDSWYDLHIQQLFDLTGRLNDLLDEVEDSGEGGASVPAPRVREIEELTDHVLELLKEVRDDR